MIGAGLVRPRFLANLPRRAVIDLMARKTIRSRSTKSARQSRPGAAAKGDKRSSGRAANVKPLAAKPLRPVEAPARYPNFLDIEPRYTDRETAAVSIIPVPYDETSTYHKGADRGPRALLAASGTVEFYDIPTGTEMYKRGLHTEPPIEDKGPPERLADLVEQRVNGALDRAQLPVVLGGEHSVSIGAIRACARRYRGMSVLQIDAHGDTRESYMGSTHNHACVMARAREWCPIVQVGIRAIDAEETRTMDRSRVFFAHEIAGNQDRSWMDRVVGLLTDDVYLTIDLDGFDPSIIPATGTPEPGGLNWYDVNELIHRVASQRRIVGFDVVELLPTPGLHSCDFIAAKLVYRILSEIFARR